LKALKGHSTRIISKRASVPRKAGTNTSSGFLKPVKISKEMSKFTGWDTKELKSRVDVTKFLCNYIREHKLQNEGDKRQINPDQKLQKLLNYDPKTSTQPLTYYHLQTLLKSHFPKAEATAITA
jgi:chromatin remodeling complex protein RSC6